VKGQKQIARRAIFVFLEVALDSRVGESGKKWNLTTTRVIKRCDVLEKETDRGTGTAKPEKNTL